MRGSAPRRGWSVRIYSSRRRAEVKIKCEHSCEIAPHRLFPRGFVQCLAITPLRLLLLAAAALPPLAPPSPLIPPRCESRIRKYPLQDPISVELPEELDPGAAQGVVAVARVAVVAPVQARLVDAEVGEGLGRVERSVRDAEALVRQRVVVVVLLEHLPLPPVAAPPQLPVAEPAEAIAPPVAQGVVGGAGSYTKVKCSRRCSTFQVLAAEST